MSELKSNHYYREIVKILDNMELSVEFGSDIGPDARMLLAYVEVYGRCKFIEALSTVGYEVLEDGTITIKNSTAISP